MAGLASVTKSISRIVCGLGVYIVFLAMWMLIALLNAIFQFAYSSIIGLPMREGRGGDIDAAGYEADNEWAGGQTVGEWRKKKKRRKTASSWSWMKVSTDTKDLPGDDQYEADDEWHSKPKMSELRKSMKRKGWGPPRGPTESESSGYIQRNIIDPEEYERERGEYYQPGDLKYDSDYAYAFGD